MSVIKGRRLNPRKILRLIIFIAVLAIGITMLRSGKDVNEAVEETHKMDIDGLLSLADYGRPTNYEPGFDSMPDGGTRLHINYLGGTLGRVFNDSNYIHLEAARKIGIKPLHDTDGFFSTSRPLVKIVSNRDYYVDELTHSHPYLVAPAATLLSDIARAFRDSLAARGGGDYRIKVTSVLRTPATVGKLKRRNVNAVEESTHLYGTTFDISYSKFICDSPKNPRTQEDLKNLLGEILFKFREEGRCLVKYERKQSCFHITATGA